MYQNLHFLRFYNLTFTMSVTFLALSLNHSISPNILASKVVKNGGVSHFNLYRILHNSNIKERLYDSTQTLSTCFYSLDVPVD